jgi:hypothetical protein
MEHSLLIIWWALSVIAALFLGSFLKPYLSRKAENLATKEDVAELTRIAKKIEADISNDVWSRQRQWELKKEVCFEVLKQLALAQWHFPVITAQSDIFRLTDKPEIRDKAYLDLAKSHDALHDMITAIGQTMLLAQATCDQKVWKTLEVAHDSIAAFGSASLAREVDDNEVRAKTIDAKVAIKSAVAAIREDLGIRQLEDVSQ